MTSRAYKKRIAESKSRLDAQFRELAQIHKGDSGADFVRVIREKTNAAINPDYAAKLTFTGDRT